MGLFLKKILCPVDFSAVSQEALRKAIEMSNKENAELIICHILPEIVPVSPLFPHYSSKTPEKKAEEMKRKTKKNLEEFISDIKDFPKERANFIIEHGDEAAEIVNIAEKHKCDLIVIGYKGRNPIARMLLGSVAESVVRHAHCSVLIVR